KLQTIRPSLFRDCASKRPASPPLPRLSTPLTPIVVKTLETTRPPSATVKLPLPSIKPRGEKLTVRTIRRMLNGKPVLPVSFQVDPAPVTSASDVAVAE